MLPFATTIKKSYKVELQFGYTGKQIYCMNQSAAFKEKYGYLLILVYI